MLPTSVSAAMGQPPFAWTRTIESVGYPASSAACSFQILFAVWNAGERRFNVRQGINEITCKPLLT